jgi:hypothetical protein|tara:strand:- start:710 stop:1357 length:648 start_codon:yes stop_codon:yes gene_type:complete
MSYTTLKANIQNYLENDSSELVDSIDVIIAQAEEMVFQRLPNLPCFRNSFTGTLVVGQADYTPTTGTPSIRMIRQVSITSSSNVIYLDHRIDSYLRDYWPNSSTTGTPIMYSTKTAADVGSGSVTTITLAPTPSATLSFQVDFIGKPVGLSSTNANTWIDTNATDVLLSAALYEASAFLKAPETLKLYKGKFDEAVQLFSQEMGRNYTAEYNGGI